MKVVEIPISCNAPHFSQEHVIFERSYNIEFEWIERERFWAIHLFDHKEEPMALGLRVIPNWPLFTRDGSTVFYLLGKTSCLELHRDNLGTYFVLVAYASAL